MTSEADSPSSVDGALSSLSLRSASSWWLHGHVPELSDDDVMRVNANFQLQSSFPRGDQLDVISIVPHFIKDNEIRLKQ